MTDDIFEFLMSKALSSFLKLNLTTFLEAFCFAIGGAETAIIETSTEASSKKFSLCFTFPLPSPVRELVKGSIYGSRFEIVNTTS